MFISDTTKEYRMQPHLKLGKGRISPVVLTCGDPARAELIANLLDASEELAYNREYRTFTGKYEGMSVTVTSHGVGSAGAAICFQELINIGAKVIIRVGTCGSLTDKLAQGDHIIVTGAVREDGVSPLLIPQGYPAIANAQVADALESISKKCNAPCKRGIILTSDLFYPGILPSSLELYSKSNVFGVEMECATLFVIASLNNIKAGAITTVDGNPLKWKDGDYDPHGEKVTKGKERMLRIAVAAAADLAREPAN